VLNDATLTKSGSGGVYYRRILRHFVCRRCGNTWKPKGMGPVGRKTEGEMGDEKIQ